MKELLNAKQTLAWNVKFPTNNGGLTSEIIKLIKIAHLLEGKRNIIIIIGIPLVETSEYEAIRAFITPQIDGNIVSFFHVNKNIILKNIPTVRGYIIDEKTFKNCKKMRNGQICELEELEENLLNSKKCIAHLIFAASSTKCAYKSMRISHTMWFVTPIKNTWIYALTRINITEGGNTTTTDLQGTERKN